MPISATRRLMTGGWGSPKIDIKDPSLVLYLPLWYPDSETTGSTIISKDRNRYSCPVTEALWTSQGRSFDGVNDFVDAGDIDPTTKTIEIWFKVNNLARENHLAGHFNYGGGTNNKGWGVYTTSAGEYVVQIAQADGTARVLETVTGPVSSTTQWYHFILTQDTTTNEGKIYHNAISIFADTVTGYTLSITNLYIGKDKTTGSDYTADAFIGEIRVYNRVLTDAEIPHNYQATKLRYQ